MPITYPTSVISVGVTQFTLPVAAPTDAPPTGAGPPQLILLPDCDFYVIEITANGGGNRTIPATTSDTLRAVYYDVDSEAWADPLQVLQTTSITFTERIAYRLDAFPTKAIALGLISPAITGGNVDAVVTPYRNRRP